MKLRQIHNIELEDSSIQDLLNYAESMISARNEDFRAMDTKASTVLGFAGALLGLEIVSLDNVVVSEVVSTTDVLLFSCMCAIFGVAQVNLIISLVLGLNVLHVRKMKYPETVKVLLETFMRVDEADRRTSVLRKHLLELFAEVDQSIRDINEEKAKALWGANASVVACIVSLVVAVSFYMAHRGIT